MISQMHQTLTPSSHADHVTRYLGVVIGVPMDTNSKQRILTCVKLPCQCFILLDTLYKHF